MQVYLVIFHMNDGHSYRTVVKGESFSSVKNSIKEKLYSFHEANEFYHFSVKDSHQNYFTVMPSNLSCIEYEFMYYEPLLSFENLLLFSEQDLITVLDAVSNDYILAVSLLITEEELKNKILNTVSPTRKEPIEHVLKLGLGRIKSDDVKEAQDKIIHIAINLSRKKLIDTSFKENK